LHNFLDPWLVPRAASKLHAPGMTDEHLNCQPHGQRMFAQRARHLPSLPKVLGPPSLLSSQSLLFKTHCGPCGLALIISRSKQRQCFEACTQHDCSIFVLLLPPPRSKLKAVSLWLTSPAELHHDRQSSSCLGVFCAPTLVRCSHRDS
jgi:hypothetical protein